MKLTSLFDKGEFVITGEVGPIKGAINRDKAIEPGCAIEAFQLHQHVHGVNVTDKPVRGDAAGIPGRQCQAQDGRY